MMSLASEILITPDYNLIKPHIFLWEINKRDIQWYNRIGRFEDEEEMPKIHSIYEGNQKISKTKFNIIDTVCMKKHITELRDTVCWFLIYLNSESNYPNWSKDLHLKTIKEYREFINFIEFKNKLDNSDNEKIVKIKFESSLSKKFELKSERLIFQNMIGFEQIYLSNHKLEEIKKNVISKKPVTRYRYYLRDSAKTIYDFLKVNTNFRERSIFYFLSVVLHVGCDLKDGISEMELQNPNPKNRQKLVDFVRDLLKHTA